MGLAIGLLVAAVLGLSIGAGSGRSRPPPQRTQATSHPQQTVHAGEPGRIDSEHLEIRACEVMARVQASM